MEEYNFIEIKNNAYKTDLIFFNSDFHIYGDVSKINSPILFSTKNYNYVIVDPDSIKDNKELIFKIGTYIYYNSAIMNDDNITYFFGDISKCTDVSFEFSHQIKKIVSYEMVEDWYPKTLSEINDKIINFFLKRQKIFGQIFIIDDNDSYNNYLFFVPNYLDNELIENGKTFIKNQLFSKELFLKKQQYDCKIKFILSDKAIEMYQRSKDKNSNTAFIAIKFNHNEERIQAIQDAISMAGFEPIIMNELEHNNWIMPEIFHQIKLAKFVVADFSLRSDGAYYESGYAEALGKVCIHMCGKENENELHFDIAQKSTIIYDSLEDLKNKLYKRIIACFD